MSAGARSRGAASRTLELLRRSKFDGMDVSDAKRLKAPESEDARLKKPLAESMLENQVTREALRRKF